jgi:hypothetical protein
VYIGTIRHAQAIELRSVCHTLDFGLSHPNFRLTVYLILCLRYCRRLGHQRRLRLRLVLLWPCLNFPIRRHSLRLRLYPSFCVRLHFRSLLLLPSRCRDVYCSLTIRLLGIGDFILLAV